LTPSGSCRLSSPLGRQRRRTRRSPASRSNLRVQARKPPSCPVSDDVLRPRRESQSQTPKMVPTEEPTRRFATGRLFRQNPNLHLLRS
jgi:hypothetical protein